MNGVEPYKIALARGTDFGARHAVQKIEMPQNHAQIMISTRGAHCARTPNFFGKPTAPPHAFSNSPLLSATGYHHEVSSVRCSFVLASAQLSSGSVTQNMPVVLDAALSLIQAQLEAATRVTLGLITPSVESSRVTGSLLQHPCWALHARGTMGGGAATAILCGFDR